MQSQPQNPEAGATETLKTPEHENLNITLTHQSNKHNSLLSALIFGQCIL